MEKIERYSPKNLTWNLKKGPKRKRKNIYKPPLHFSGFMLFFWGRVYKKMVDWEFAGISPNLRFRRQGMSFLQEMGVYGVYDSSDRLQYIGLSRLFRRGDRSTGKSAGEEGAFKDRNRMKQFLDEFRVECCK